MSHKKYRTDTDCLNCGAEVSGKFCSTCGQENIETRDNFFHLATHTIGDFFHYDSKFFRSLRPLFTKPGFLTLEYWKGRRSYYIHPLRLFFFITIIMVITANAYYKKFERQIKEEKIVRTGPAPATEAEKKTLEENEKRVIAMVNTTFDFMAVYLKYLSFLLLPIYALAFKILYWKQKRFYVDHLVYTLHVQSFVYIIISMILLVPLFIYPESRAWINFVVIGMTAIYLVVSLRQVYKQSWVKTIIKSMLATLYMLFATIFFIAAIMLTFFSLSKV